MLSKKAQSISLSPTMAIDSKAKELKAQGVDVIGFGAGEPDFDTPAHIREAAIKAINEGHTRYTPAAGTLELKEAICKKFKNDNKLDYEAAQIVVSSGAKNSLFNALSAVINPGDEVLIPVPYWVSYPELVKLNDGTPIAVRSSEKNKLKVTVEDLKDHYTAKTKVLILNSPTNPTGQVYSADELKAIADFCSENNIMVIADEVYEKLIYSDARHVSIASFNERIKELAIIVNGASKSYAMTGWRIGYTASSPEIAKIMGAVQSHATGNPNAIAQKAAVAALQNDQACVEEMRLVFDERRQYMYERINKMPYLNALEPIGAFYLFFNLAEAVGKSYKGEKIGGSDDFARLLLDEQKVALVPGTGFGAPNYMRLSFATSMENIKEGLNRLEAFVGDLQ